MKVRMPGISGMGECVLCGDSFAINVLLGENYHFVSVDGFDIQLPMHAKCSRKFNELIGQDWTALPDGPLRREFAESAAK